jgi:hypothetical protein
MPKRLKDLANGKHSRFFGPLTSYAETETVFPPINLLHNSQVDPANRLECYMPKWMKGLTKNTLAYLAHLQVLQKLRLYWQHFIFL